MSNYTELAGEMENEFGVTIKVVEFIVPLFGMLAAIGHLCHVADVAIDPLMSDRHSTGNAVNSTDNDNTDNVGYRRILLAVYSCLLALMGMVSCPSIVGISLFVNDRLIRLLARIKMASGSNINSSYIDYIGNLQQWKSDHLSAGCNWFLVFIPIYFILCAIIHFTFAMRPPSVKTD